MGHRAEADVWELWEVVNICYFSCSGSKPCLRGMDWEYDKYLQTSREQGEATGCFAAFRNSLSNKRGTKLRMKWNQITLWWCYLSVGMFDLPHNLLPRQPTLLLLVSSSQLWIRFSPLRWLMRIVQVGWQQCLLKLLMGELPSGVHFVVWRHKKATTFRQETLIKRATPLIQQNI